MTDQERDDIVRRLQQERNTFKTIAVKVGVRITAVRAVYAQEVAAGRLKRRKGITDDGKDVSSSSSDTDCPPRVSAPVREIRKGEDREVTSREAARLRGEGLSLRAIGKKLGVDQKQVQRWLLAAKDPPRPRRVQGLDGHNYPAAKVSAPEGGETNAADGVSWLEHNILCALYERLAGARHVVVTMIQAWRKANRQGLSASEATPLVAAARQQALRRTELVDDEDDGRLELLLADLAGWLSRDGLALLRDDIDHLLPNDHLLRQECPQPEST
jgi:hypothetical protein